jgi:hypothetical protein
MLFSLTDFVFTHCSQTEPTMPRKTVWTDGQDAQIRRLRTEGAPWDVVALALGLARWTVIERARAIGAERPPAHAVTIQDDPDRQPLPAGHAETWNAINRGTGLEGVPFQTPSTLR